MYEPDDELNRDEYTEYIFHVTCFGDPVDPETAEDVQEGIARAVELAEHPVFLEGTAAALTDCGLPCSAEDTETMLQAVKQRYQSQLGKPCPRTVQEWCRGTVPGVTNRQNHYELCYALGLDFRKTAVFFQKYFLTMPFNVKSKVDAVFMYALYHEKPYAAAAQLLNAAKCFVSQENAHTATAQIVSMICKIDDDTRFLEYLSQHCYEKEQQFQLARTICKDEISRLKAGLPEDDSVAVLSPARLNSLTVAALLGYRYQGRDKNAPASKLPKRFNESLPNDVTLGKILNDNEISYEVLRKTLMLLKFYNYYHEAETEDRKRGYIPTKYEINNRLMDFYDELNSVLISCGFAQLYVRHPFDALLLYCANSYDPILTMHLLNERN